MTDGLVSVQARRATLTLLGSVGAFETAPDGTWDFVTPALLALLGDLPASSLLGREWISRIHRDDVQRVVAEYRQAREFRRPWNMHFRMLGSEPVPVWVAVNATPLPGPFDSRGIVYIGLVKDVTAEKRAEAVAREAERTLAAFSDFVSEGLVVARSEFIIAANAAACRLLGVASADELLGASIWSFVVPGDEHRYGLPGAERGETFMTAQVRPRGGGEPFVASVRGRPLQYAGAPARIITFRSVDDPHAVLASEDRYRRRLEALESLLPMAYHRVSLEGDTFSRIEFANEHFCRLLGRTPEEVIGHSVLEFTHPDHLEASRTGMAGFASRDGARKVIHRMWEHADGHPVHAAMSLSIYRDPVTGHAVSLALSTPLDPDDPAIPEMPIR